MLCYRSDFRLNRYSVGRYSVSRWSGVHRKMHPANYFGRCNRPKGWTSRIEYFVRDTDLPVYSTPPTTDLPNIDLPTHRPTDLRPHRQHPLILLVPKQDQIIVHPRRLVLGIPSEFPV